MGLTAYSKRHFSGTMLEGYAIGVMYIQNWVRKGST